LRLAQHGVVSLPVLVGISQEQRADRPCPHNILTVTKKTGEKKSPVFYFIRKPDVMAVATN